MGAVNWNINSGTMGGSGNPYFDTPRFYCIVAGQFLDDRKGVTSLNTGSRTDDQSRCNETERNPGFLPSIQYFKILLGYILLLNYNNFFIFFLYFIIYYLLYFFIYFYIFV